MIATCPASMSHASECRFFHAVTAGCQYSAAAAHVHSARHDRRHSLQPRSTAAQHFRASSFAAATFCMALEGSTRHAHLLLQRVIWADRAC